jgi:hypothetical protein
MHKDTRAFLCYAWSLPIICTLFHFMDQILHWKGLLVKRTSLMHEECHTLEEDILYCVISWLEPTSIGTHFNFLDWKGLRWSNTLA